MNRMAKKKGNVFVAVFCVLVVLQMTFISAFAGNIQDKDFSYNFNQSNIRTTPERFKDDSTSAYMYCQTALNAGDSYTAEVWGVRSEESLQSCQGPEYSFSAGVTHFMINYVYENDMDLAFIKGYLEFNSSSTGSAYFAGVWSPDSV